MMSVFKNIYEIRIKNSLFLFLLLVGLSIAFQFREASLLPDLWEQLLDGCPLPTLFKIVLVFVFLMWFGWRVLGSTQRLGWIGFCAISALTFAQGIFMHSFYADNQTGMPALAESMGNSLFFFLILYFVYCLPLHRLEFFVRTGLIVSGITLMFLCLFQLFPVQDPDISRLVPIDAYGLYSDAFRLYGTSGPAITAGVLVLCWPAILGRHFDRRSFGVQLFVGVGILSFLVILFLTYTRSVYLGVILQVLLMCAVFLRTNLHSMRQWVLRGLLVLIPAFCVMLILIPSIARRFAYLMQPTDASVGHRLQLYQSLISLLSERPLCGWGFGMFELLYKAYERIPGVAYTYGPAHSTILLFLFQAGLIGGLLFPLAFCGWNLLRSLTRIPLWMGLSIAGILPLLISDNLTVHYVGFKYPLMLFAALLVGYGRLYDRRFACPRWLLWTVPAAVACWVIAALQSPAEPVDRLNARLEQSARRMRGDVSVIVGDLAAERCWQYEAGTSYTSILAGITTPVHAALMQNPDEECSVRGYQVAPGGAEILGQSVRRSDLVTLVLSNPTKENIGYLLQSVDEEQLKRSNQELFGDTVYTGARWKSLCSACAPFEVQSTYEPPASRLTDIATTATVTQLLRAYSHLTDYETTGSKTVRSGLSVIADRSGFVRNIVNYHGYLLGISAYTGSYREEVLLSRGDWEGWGIVARYQAPSAVAPRIDAVSNRMFAQMAWNVYCYYDMFSPDKSNTGSKTGYRPWFLRTGRTCWTTPFKY